jgi:Uma2 family endonuclease
MILDEPEMHLAGHVLVPDLAGWRRERMPELPTDKAYFDLTPDWVCEVLSPSTAALDRGAKRRIYCEQGVSHLWLVDPDVRTLEVFSLDGSSYRLLDVSSGDALIRAVPFDAIEIELGALWA